MVTVKCLQCGKEFIGHRCKNRKYCSKKCYGKSMVGIVRSAEHRKHLSEALIGKIKGEQIKRVCPTCGKVRFVTSGRLKTSHANYCSRKCYFKFKHPTPKEIRECLKCGKIFTPFNAEVKKGGGKYCSKTCYDTHRYEMQFTTRNCNVCGKTFTYDKQYEKKYCSVFCQITQFKKIMAERWANSKRSFLYGDSWTEALREAIRNKYYHKCAVCGVPEIEEPRKHSIHHIDENKKNNNIDNLIALCSYCHAGVHRKQINLTEAVR